MKGESSGDTSAKGITISKNYFVGDNFAIISFLPPIPPIMETDYKECMIKGIQEINPNAKFYIATEYKRINSIFIAATRENIVKSIVFLKENIYRMQHFNEKSFSIDDRLIEAYMAAPDKEDSHIILILDNSRQLTSTSFMKIPYCFMNHPKKVKLSIILTRGSLDLDELKKYFRNKKLDYDSLLNLSVLSGGDVIVKDIKKAFTSKAQADKWFDNLRVQNSRRQ